MSLQKCERYDYRGRNGKRTVNYRDGRTTFGLVYGPPQTGISNSTFTLDRVRSTLSHFSVGGARFHVTGLDALKAVLLSLVSVASAWGIMVLIWQDGFGSKAIWGITGTGEIDSWIPLIVFAFLFGLSMDYEVFLLSRVREEYDATGSTNHAVVTGIGRIGRLITGAALILFLAFVTMTSGPQTQIKMLGTGLAAGILLDATVVRVLLVPALVVLLGKWNWWLPDQMARLLRVNASRPAQQPQHALEEIGA